MVNNYHGPRGCHRPCCFSPPTNSTRGCRPRKPSRSPRPSRGRGRPTGGRRTRQLGRDARRPGRRHRRGRRFPSREPCAERVADRSGWLLRDDDDRAGRAGGGRHCPAGRTAGRDHPAVGRTTEAARHEDDRENAGCHLGDGRDREVHCRSDTSERDVLRVGCRPLRNEGRDAPAKRSPRRDRRAHRRDRGGVRRGFGHHHGCA